MEELDLWPGNYHLTIEIRDKGTKNTGRYKQDIAIESYGEKELSISDIQIAASISLTLEGDKFTKNGLRVVPCPTKQYKEPQLIYIYYEIYNLSGDSYGRTHFQTDFTVAALSGDKNVVSQIVSGLGSLVGVDRKEGEITVSYEDRGTSETEIGYTSIDMGDSPPGEYRLTITVEDSNSGESVEKSVVFTVLE